MHQVELLHRSLLRSGQVNGRSIVDDDVDAPELGHGFLDRLLDLVLVTDVDDARQSLATRSFNLKIHIAKFYPLYFYPLFYPRLPTHLFSLKKNNQPPFYSIF